MANWLPALIWMLPAFPAPVLLADMLAPFVIVTEPLVRILMLPPGLFPDDWVKIPLPAPSIVTLCAELPAPVGPWTVIVPPLKGAAGAANKARATACSAPLLLRIWPPLLIARL